MSSAFTRSSSSPDDDLTVCAYSAAQAYLHFLPLFLPITMSTHSQSSANVVGVHYRVGKKIGEGSFGVIFEGPSLSFAHCDIQVYAYRL